MLYQQVREAVKESLGPWWAFLIAGVVWFLISIIVLQLNLRSVTTVGVLLGILFLISAIEEFFVAAVIDSWAWARALLGIFFSSQRYGRLSTPSARSSLSLRRLGSY